METKHSKVFMPPLENNPTDAEISKTCMFTGHRVISYEDMNLAQRVETELETMITVKGMQNFVTGGARGFDTLAGMAVVRLRSKYPNIKFILALPCQKQTVGWSSTEKAAFDYLAEQADELRYVNLDFFPACMHRRNDYMISISSCCISYLRRNTGGTAYTVNAARKKGLEIISL